MKVKDLIKKLKQTGLNNEVYLINSNKDNSDEDYTENIYLSFDDNGDVVIYEE